MMYAMIRTMVDTGKMIVSGNYIVRFEPKLSVLTCKPDTGFLLFLWFPGFHWNLRNLRLGLSSDVIQARDVAVIFTFTLLDIPWGSLVHTTAITRLLLTSAVPLTPGFGECEKDDLDEWDQLAANEPDIDHLDVGSGGKSLHHSDEDGGEYQHCGQVDTKGRLKEVWFEEGGCPGDQNKKNRWQVSRHQLIQNFSFEHNFHLYSLLWLGGIGRLQGPIGDEKECHVDILLHPQLTRKQSYHLLVQLLHLHGDDAHLHKDEAGTEVRSLHTWESKGYLCKKYWH